MIDVNQSSFFSSEEAYKKFYKFVLQFFGGRPPHHPIHYINQTCTFLPLLLQWVPLLFFFKLHFSADTFEQAIFFLLNFFLLKTLL